MRFLPILVGAIALTLCNEASAQHSSHDYLFVFGDSLSDNGNLFALTGTPGKPYWKGRFSNGKVCAEQLAGVLGIKRRRLRDFALGGATTTDVQKRQVEPALAALRGKLPRHSMCFYWAGANDLLGLLGNPSGNPSLVIGNAMQQTATSLLALHFAGARKIIVVNIPDLSKTPRVIALNDPRTAAGAAALAQAYNQALAGTIAQITSVYKMDVVIVNSFALVNDIVKDPKRRMFRVVDKPILQPNGKTKKHARRYLFFDDIHPSFTGHREIMRSTLLALGRTIPGDVNGDAVVNRKDISAMARSFGRRGRGSPADLNHDGRVDSRDMKILRRMLEGK
jgi:outer membrane lipase/esterase